MQRQLGLGGQADGGDEAFSRSCDRILHRRVEPFMRDGSRGRLHQSREQREAHRE
jgi:hypothetical protein